MRRISPDVIAPPIGAYSHLTFVPRDRQLVFIAGQVGSDRDGVLAEGAEEQTERTLRNIEALLASIGASPRDLVRLLTFVGGEEHLPGFYAARNRVYREWFGDDPVPGHSLAVVAALAAPGIHVEIEGWAAVPAEGPQQ